ncbi:MAG: PQQ-dependent sugar dehydrogenase [Thermoleophilaceae bacterium]|nr:PQQ-dependent sugar dehydrogenase [Thermoleophilaceae bacterium]
MSARTKHFRSIERGRTALGVVLVVLAAISLWACSSGKANNETSSAAQEAPATITAARAKTYVSGTAAAVGLAFDNVGRLLYAEKDEGRIMRVARGKRTTLARLGVAGGGEPGLLGLAVDGANNVYAYYTTSRGGCPDPTSSASSGDINAHCIWRFRPSGGKLKADRLIFSAGHPSTATNHVGGGLHFGPDGALYLGLGELGENGDPDNGPGRAQNLSIPFGKILRLDPNATNKGAAGNPTTCGDADNSAQRTISDTRIYACGLRNPYSFDWDRSGRLWVAEAGDSCDEINIVRAGVNYGWEPPRTDCSGAGEGAPIRKVTGTPSGVAIPKSKQAGSWRNDVFWGIFAESSLKRYDIKSRKVSNVNTAKGRAGWDLIANDRYLYMSNGSRISRLALPGA